MSPSPLFLFLSPSRLHMGRMETTSGGSVPPPNPVLKDICVSQASSVPAGCVPLLYPSVCRCLVLPPSLPADCIHHAQGLSPESFPSSVDKALASVQLLLFIAFCASLGTTERRVVRCASNYKIRHHLVLWSCQLAPSMGTMFFSNEGRNGCSVCNNPIGSVSQTLTMLC